MALTLTPTLNRWSHWLGSVLPGRRAASLQAGTVRLLDEGDGQVERREIEGTSYIRPAENSYYLYFQAPESLLNGPLYVEIVYEGDAHGPFHLEYPARGREGLLGCYVQAVQRWDGQTGERTLRRCRYLLEDYDGSRRQNYGAHFRIHTLAGNWIRDVRVSGRPLHEAEAFPHALPDVALLKTPERFHKIQWLFLELTNLCNFCCTFCPDGIMERKRGWMPTEQVFDLLDQIAANKPRLGPINPIKLHQMGEPMIHKDIVPIVAKAEELGLGIELNTNASLLKEEKVVGLYKVGLTSFVLSYLNHDEEAFGTRKAKNSKLTFQQYRQDIERAVELKFAQKARARIQLHVANAFGNDEFGELVSTTEEARAELESWLAFGRKMEEAYTLPPSGLEVEAILARDVLAQDEMGSRIELLPGVDLLWKRIHNWGSVIPGGDRQPGPAYCIVPYEQFVIQYNGDVSICCTDYDGGIRVGNVFQDDIETIWRGPQLRQLRETMYGGDIQNPVCRKCRNWD